MNEWFWALSMVVANIKIETSRYSVPHGGAHTTTCEVVLPQIEPESNYTSRSNSCL